MRFHRAMLEALEERDDNVVQLRTAIHRPATPVMTRRRNELAHVRALIEERLREIKEEKSQALNDDERLLLDNEEHTLRVQWDATCPEWDRIWMRGAE